MQDNNEWFENISEILSQAFDFHRCKESIVVFIKHYYTQHTNPQHRVVFKYKSVYYILKTYKSKILLEMAGRASGVSRPVAPRPLGLIVSWIDSKLTLNWDLKVDLLSTKYFHDFQRNSDSEHWGYFIMMDD